LAPGEPTAFFMLRIFRNIQKKLDMTLASCGRTPTDLVF
jgi:hypothetical protein